MLSAATGAVVLAGEPWFYGNMPREHVADINRIMRRDIEPAP